MESINEANQNGESVRPSLAMTCLRHLFAMHLLQALLGVLVGLVLDAGVEVSEVRVGGWCGSGAGRRRADGGRGAGAGGVGRRRRRLAAVV